MKQKLLTAAIGAALAVGPTLAFAGVSVGGMAQVEVGRLKETGNLPGAAASAGPVAGASFNGTIVNDNNRGRFWIAADEDLGNGLTGLGLYTFKVDTTGVAGLDGPNGSNTMEKWVGLKGDFGTFRAGSLRSPYKYAAGVMWDAFVTTDLEARGNGGMANGTFGQGSYFDNSIGYTSPNLAGLTFGVVYTPNKAATNTCGTPGYGPGAFDCATTSFGDYSAALEWKNMGWDAVVARTYARNLKNSLTTYTGTGYSDKVALRYNFANQMALMGQYEWQKTSNYTTNADSHDYFVGFDANTGHFTWVAQVGQTKNKTTTVLPGADASANTALSNYGNDPYALGTAAPGKINYYALGGFYNFSKTFNVFAGYGETDHKPDAAGGVEGKAQMFTVGMRILFGMKSVPVDYPSGVPY